MKREEKNQQTRRRIMDSALNEFSRKGYGASSINNICAAQGISKGIIYHYFETKDALFLACIEECFRLLTDEINVKMQKTQENLEQGLEEYFAVRMSFFREHPVYQRIFCEGIITPPAHLRAEIQTIKQEFDNLNITIIKRLLKPVPLRSAITQDEVIEMFREFQDFINARYQMNDIDRLEFEMRERYCQKALNILLYGVIERSDH
ncbi:Rut operon repressor [uncultured Eubacterium sp.]|nr:Rut operon repressor [uncultured Eubacterium sp.]